MVTICAVHKKKILRISRLINNIGLWREARNQQNQLQPVARALDLLQGDQMSIADACEVWLELFDNQFLVETHMAKLQVRFDQAMTSSNFLANLLHPRYMGQKLSAEQQEIARQLPNTQHPTLLPLTLAFQAKTLPFPPLFFSETCTSSMSGAVWWKCLKSANTNRIMQTFDETTHSACKFCVNRENILELQHATNKATKSARTCKNCETCFVLPVTLW